MNPPPIRAVYDCNVLLQAVLSGDGPAFRCLSLVEENRVALFLSEPILTEARDVLLRPKILRKNPHVTPERVTQFLDFLVRKATFIEDVPHVVSFPRDPKDEPYLDLAVGSHAQYLITRDSKHLLTFAREETPQTVAFRSRYPLLRIIDPPTFLREMDLVRHQGKQPAQPPKTLHPQNRKDIDQKC